MTESTSPILFDAADRYANETSDASIRPDLRMAFVAGAEWQWKRIDDNDAEIKELRAHLQYIATQWPDSFAAYHARAALKEKADA